jgi:hypothetical protein
MAIKAYFKRLVRYFPGGTDVEGSYSLLVAYYPVIGLTETRTLLHVVSYQVPRHTTNALLGRHYFSRRYSIVLPSKFVVSAEFHFLTFALCSRKRPASNTLHSMFPFFQG